MIQISKRERERERPVNNNEPRLQRGADMQFKLRFVGIELTSWLLFVCAVNVPYTSLSSV